MKVDIYTDTYKPEINGVVTQVESLKKNLEVKKHLVNIFTTSVPHYHDIEKNVHRIHSLKVVKSIEQRLALPSKNLISAFRSRPDVIHGHTPGPMGAFGLMYSKLIGVPYVFTYHTLLTEYTHYIFNGKLIRPKLAKNWKAT